MSYEPNLNGLVHMVLGDRRGLAHGWSRSGDLLSYTPINDWKFQGQFHRHEWFRSIELLERIKSANKYSPLAVY